MKLKIIATAMLLAGCSQPIGADLCVAQPTLGQCEAKAQQQAETQVFGHKAKLRDIAERIKKNEIERRKGIRERERERRDRARDNHRR